MVSQKLAFYFYVKTQNRAEVFYVTRFCAVLKIASAL